MVSFYSKENGERTLDGKGKILVGNNLEKGISIDKNKTNLESIKNYVLSNFDIGLSIIGRKNLPLLIENIRAEKNAFVGFYIYTSSNNTLTNNTANNNTQHGIYLYSSSNNTLTNNTINNNDVGIYLPSSSENVITNNTIENNRWIGIYLIFIGINNKNLFQRNFVSSNQLHGIHIVGKNNIFVEDIYVQNKQSGMLVHYPETQGTALIRTLSLFNESTGMSITDSAKDTLVITPISLYNSGNKYGIPGADLEIGSGSNDTIVVDPFVNKIRLDKDYNSTIVITPQYKKKATEIIDYFDKLKAKNPTFAKILEDKDFNPTKEFEKGGNLSKPYDILDNFFDLQGINNKKIELGDANIIYYNEDNNKFKALNNKINRIENISKQNQNFDAEKTPHSEFRKIYAEYDITANDIRGLVKEIKENNKNNKSLVFFLPENFSSGNFSEIRSI